MFDKYAENMVKLGTKENNLYRNCFDRDLQVTK